jgi:cysteine-rich repeat protein
MRQSIAVAMGLCMVACPTPERLPDAGPAPVEVVPFIDAGAADAGSLPDAGTVDSGVHIDAGAPRCGDARLRSDVLRAHPGYEECDDGNDDDEDGCTSICRRPVLKITVGSLHSCVLRADRTVACVGLNGSREVGRGTTARHEPVLRPVVGLSGVLDLSTGRSHSCVVVEGGDVWCWGYGGYRVQGSEFDRSQGLAHRIPGIEGAVEVGAGQHYSCVRTAAGAIGCWGRDHRGQLGNGEVGDGEGVVQWIEAFAAQGTPALALDVGLEHACAIVAGGEVRCWGRNTGGQLADGTRTHRDAPVTMLVAATGLPVTGVASVHCAADHTSVRKDDGTIMGVGLNHVRQISQATDYRFSSGLVPSDTWGTAEAIYTRDHNFCALQAGVLSCLGANNFGEVGDGGGGVIIGTPRAIDGVSDVAGLALGYYHSCLWTKSGRNYCSGWNLYGERWTQGGTWGVATSPVAVSAPAALTQLSVGEHHACALGDDSQAYCWGQNSYGETGQPVGQLSITPLQFSEFDDVLHVSAGRFTTAVLRSDGTVWSAGLNTNGELGHGSASPFESETQQVVGLGANVDQIEMASSFSCARTSDGGVACWGYNGQGSLGDGSNSSRHSPAAVVSPDGNGPLTDAQSLTVGYRHACVLEGSFQTAVVCWGYNAYGQVGDNSTTNVFTPVRVVGPLSPVKVSAGRLHTCVLDQSGAVMCWGYNGSGELGTGDTVQRRAPYLMAVPPRIIDVWAAGRNTCVRMAPHREGLPNRLLCSGNAYWGTLGDGSFSSKTQPINIPDHAGLQHLEGGAYHTCGLTSGGTAGCWGVRAQGRMGDGGGSAEELSPRLILPVH